MESFFFKIKLFLLPVIVYSASSILMLPFLFSTLNGPSTAQQIKSSFKNSVYQDYELLILGNSRTYRGINPDMLFTKSYNFSHDDDSYNQLYYKLKFILNKKNSIKYLIVNVDYFMFSFISDKRNYVYGDYLGQDYLDDYHSNKFELKAKHLLENANPKKALYLNLNKSKAKHKKNGQFIRDRISNKNDKVQRNINRLKIQEEYYNKILHLCEKNNITTFLVMLPLRTNELSSYTKSEIQEFNSFINKSTNKNLFYLNYGESKAFKTADFTDITHLNELAANRFSKILSKDIEALIKTWFE